MHLSWRDGLASVLVGAEVIVYLFWLSGTVGDSSVVAAVVFALGLAASVIAVVFGVGAGLLQASKVYLVVCSLIGLVALVTGVIAIANGSDAMLAALVVGNIVLWLLATVRHSISTDTHQQTTIPSEPAGARG